MRNLFVFFALLFAITAKSQIQRTFFGFTLGKTTKTDLVKSLKEKGKKILNTNVNDETIRVNNLTFGGKKWPATFFMFYNNSLCVVSFTDTGEYSSEDKLDLDWENISKILSQKYSVYQKKNTKYEIEYNDNKTNLWTSNEPYNGYKSIILMYSDNYLFKLKRNKDKEDF